MSKITPNDIARFWLERSHRTVDEARLMAANGWWDTCASRLYYACFYALSALFKLHALPTSKHSGVRSLFFQHFVKTGKVSTDIGELYRVLFEARREGDYEPSLVLNEAEVAPWIVQVEDFINTIEQLFEEKDQQYP